MKNLIYLLIISPFMAVSQTTPNVDKNYILVTSYLDPFDKGLEYVATNEQKIENIGYFDGIGRPLQNIAIRAGGNQQDLISSIFYDASGRQPIDYLPFSISSNNGSYNVSSIDELNSFYLGKFPNDSNNDQTEINPYSEKYFDNSPLNRVLEQGAPGWDWLINPDTNTDHTIKFDYKTNVTGEVTLFLVDFVNGNTVDPDLVYGGVYMGGELYKTITKDENWTSNSNALYGVAYEYKNKKGQVILKRISVYDSNKTDQDPNYHDTYYVYDDFGNLTFVLSPEASEIIKSTATQNEIDDALNDLGYQYKYDYRNRLIEKKIPGKGWEYILYNKLDQPVMTQDAMQRIDNEWSFIKYDAFGRITFTGILKTYYTYPQGIQLFIDMGDQYETQTSSPNQIGLTDQTMVYYTNNTWISETGEVTLHTVNYYDDYIDMDGMSVSNSVYGISTIETPIGLPTVLKVRVLGYDDWITSYTLYDDKARVLLSRSKNNYLDTNDYTANILDFTGKVIESHTSHIKEGNQAIHTSDYFTYDHMERLKTHQQQIDNEQPELITRNNYDALGQLVTKSVGGKTIVNGFTDLKKVDISTNGVITNQDDDWLWESRAKTKGEIPGEEEGYVQLIINQDNQATRFGFVETGNNNNNYGNDYYDFGIHLNRVDSGSKVLVVSGTSMQWYNNETYVEGDLFRVQRKKNTNTGELEILFYHNNNNFHTISNLSPEQQDKALLGKLSFHGPNSGSVQSFTIEGTNFSTTLENINYKYNIRGWLTDINDIDAPLTKDVETLRPDLFNFRINYNHVEDPNNATPLYNGNISQTFWKTENVDKNVRGYNYIYDNLNRIMEAHSYKGVALNNISLTDTHTLSGISYDRNGNIESLVRLGTDIDHNPADAWDDLDYVYNGNQLLKVDDDSVHPTYKDFGFKDGTNNGNDYTYDFNGNLKTDENKDIGDIEYNHLNLPTLINFGSQDEIAYVYDATGVKLEKTVFDTTNNKTIVTQYDGNYIYSDNEVSGTLKLQFFNHPEGYIEPVAETLKSVKGFSTGPGGGGTTTYSGYSYVFQYKDHLGNVRLSYTDADLNGSIDPDTEIIEESNFYPFGLKQKGYNNVVEGGNSLAQNWKYNGKELNEDLGLNMYEYGGRMYDPAVGRWFVNDRLADDEMQIDKSPYAYSWNSPISLNDPDGDCPWCIGALVGGITEYAVQATINFANGDSVGDALWNNIDGADVLVATGEGALTGGGSALRRIAITVAAEGAKAAIDVYGDGTTDVVGTEGSNKTVSGVLKEATINTVVSEGLNKVGAADKLVDASSDAAVKSAKSNVMAKSKNLDKSNNIRATGNSSQAARGSNAQTSNSSYKSFSAAKQSQDATKGLNSTVGKVNDNVVKATVNTAQGAAVKKVKDQIEN